MRTIFFLVSFLLSYPLGELQAISHRCPKIDHAMLQADTNHLTKGGELELNGYRWRVTGGNLCDPSCGDRYQQALQPRVTTRASFTSKNGSASCSYKFMLEDKEVADLTLATDDSMKLPALSPQRWSEVPANPEQLMEQEEELYRDDPRVRLE